MKKLFLFFAVSLMLTSCASQFTEIGSLDYLSNKTVDAGGNYRKIAMNAGHKKRDLLRTASLNVKDAIDSLLNRYPGGLFITNAKIYIVRNEFIAISGDVWGNFDMGGSLALSEEVSPNMPNKH